MRKHYPIRFLVMSLMLVASVFSIVVTTRVAHADITIPKPTWWVDNNGAFSQCDAYYYNHGHTINGTLYAGLGFNSYREKSWNRIEEYIWKWFSIVISVYVSFQTYRLQCEHILLWYIVDCVESDMHETLEMLLCLDRYTIPVEE